MTAKVAKSAIEIYLRDVLAMFDSILAKYSLALFDMLDANNLAADFARKELDGKSEPNTITIYVKTPNV